VVSFHCEPLINGSPLKGINQARWNVGCYHGLYLPWETCEHDHRCSLLVATTTSTGIRSQRYVVILLPQINTTDTFFITFSSFLITLSTDLSPVILLWLTNNTLRRDVKLLRSRTQGCRCITTAPFSKMSINSSILFLSSYFSILTQSHVPTVSNC
jgi:hypothetical protein